MSSTDEIDQILSIFSCRYFQNILTLDPFNNVVCVYG